MPDEDDFAQAMHLVELAQVRAALLALLHSFADAGGTADEITVTLDQGGVSLAYLHGGNEVAGEAF